MSKISFTLVGDGARGVFQAQAILELEQNGIIPHSLIGVSSGAINSCGYSLLGAQGLVDFWKNITKMSDVFSFNWQFLWQNGLYTPAPIESKLQEFKDFQFQVPVSFPLLDLKSGKLFWRGASYGHLSNDRIEAICSAVSIPGLVRSLNGYVDGGAYLLCPLKKAIDDGADHIYVIMARNPDDEPEYKESKFMPMASACYRSLDLMMHKLIISDIETALSYNERPDKKKIDITLVYPEKPLFGTIDFKKVPELFANPVKVLTKKLS